MSFDQLFDKGFKKRNRGHFASLVRMALTDNKITSEELQFLHRVAKKLQIDVLEFNQIIENPNQFPINPPSSNDRRLERLYDLSKMAFADPELRSREKSLLTKMCVGLGFPISSIESIVTTAIENVSQGNDLETFFQQVFQLQKS